MIDIQAYNKISELFSLNFVVITYVMQYMLFFIGRFVIYINIQRITQHMLYNTFYNVNL